MRIFTPPGLCVALFLALASPALAAEKPTYTDRFNAGDEAEYVLEKITRKGRDVTLTLSVTLTKGNRRTLQFFGVNTVDGDGKEQKTRVNGSDPRPKPESVTLRPGVKTKLEIRFPLDPKISKLQVLEVTMSFVERVAIKFSDVEVPSR